MRHEMEFDDGLVSDGKSEKGSSGEHSGLTMLFCVLAAIFIWFYVMSVDSPTSVETFSSVGVSIVNDGSSGLTAMSGTGSIVEVTLKGRKSQLGSLKAEDIIAYADVSSVNIAGKANYPVVVEAPDGTIIDDYYPKEISVYLDKRDQKVIEVDCQLKDYMVGAAYSLDSARPTINPETVVVTGPARELSRVDHARMTLSPGNIDQSFTGKNSLELIDVNGNVMESRYISLSQTDAEASYHVYTSKYVSLSVDYKYGYFAENGTTVTISPTRIKVRGLVEQLNQLSTISVGTVDETRITESGVYNYALMLPDGIELDGTSVENVSVDVQLHGSQSSRLTVKKEQMQLVNVPEGKQAQILDESLRVALRGTGMDVMYIKSDEVQVIVDLLNVGNGDQFVTAEVTLLRGESAALYVVGDYMVQVRVEDLS